MPLIKHTDYRPDISDYEGTAGRYVLNVVPQASTSQGSFTLAHLNNTQADRTFTYDILG
jgi:hypothetical protein